MSFKYINPGYIGLIGDKSNATEIIGTEYSKTGISFTQTNLSATKGVPIPEFNAGDDFWARFDFFLPTSGNFQICCLAPGTNKFGFQAYRNSNNVSVSAVYLVGNSSQTLATGKISDGTAEDNCGFKFNAVNSAILHVYYGDLNAAYMDIQVNDKKFRSENYKAINYSASYYDKQSLFYTSTTTTPISNIILSNEEIDIKETIIAVPISSSETDMNFDSETGIYTADSANQTLLSSVNVNSLINEYGSDSKVTGIALIGNPAYKTAAELSSLTAISKQNNSVTTHGTISLTEDTAAKILDSRKIDMKISDLQNVQFGWKAGT